VYALDNRQGVFDRYGSQLVGSVRVKGLVYVQEHVKLQKRKMECLEYNKLD
jgi:hypothetical protein